MTPLIDPGTSPTVLDTFAVTGGSPKASNAGKVMRVPDPTMVLMPPAATPAARIASCSSQVMIREAIGLRVHPRQSAPGLTGPRGEALNWQHHAAGSSSRPPRRVLIGPAPVAGFRRAGRPTNGIPPHPGELHVTR